MATVDYLFEQSGFAIEDLAERAGLPLERVEAIVVGRWLPSPTDRKRIAEAFGVTPEEISWGHTMDPRNIRYRRHGFRER
jgi:lambda repressor-like predicted transcriptional regulator